MLEKEQLRKSLREKLNQINNNTYERWSSQIAEHVFRTKEWKQASTIGITISTKREVDTKRIIERAWAENKTVCVPRCIPTTKKMEFRQITNFNQLEVVYFSLQEPIVEKTERIEQSDIQLLFVPGLGFSKNGYRIGQGGGYYDRYLITFTGKTVSLAFSFQLLDRVPTEEFDLPVQKIVTEEQVMSCHD